MKFSSKGAGLFESEPVHGRLGEAKRLLSSTYSTPLSRTPLLALRPLNPQPILKIQLENKMTEFLQNNNNKAHMTESNQNKIRFSLIWHLSTEALNPCTASTTPNMLPLFHTGSAKKATDYQNSSKGHGDVCAASSDIQLISLMGNKIAETNRNVFSIQDQEWKIIKAPQRKADSTTPISSLSSLQTAQISQGVLSPINPFSSSGSNTKECKSSQAVSEVMSSPFSWKLLLRSSCTFSSNGNSIWGVTAWPVFS